MTIAAVAIDSVLGDPDWMPHPVRAIGWMIGRGEPLMRQMFPKTPNGERCAGALLTCAVVTATTAVAARGVRNRPLELVTGASTLALRNLLDEAGAIAAALEAGDVAHARTRLARIVGRDTANLDESEIARGAIESLAESSCDGVVAPLIYLACGGVSAALAYKAINTLDSMIGHLEEPYRYFGAFAARLDDVANYVPARIAAACITAAAALLEGNAKAALATWRSDGALHRSPNAGQTEAAMAGALRIRLGGDNIYDGIPVPGPRFGAAFRNAEPGDVRRAMRIVTLASALAYAAAVAWSAIRDGRS